MNEPDRDVMDNIHREDVANPWLQAQPPVDRPTIHYSELPEDHSDSPTAKEWNFYLGEVGRLLAEGHEGKWVLIKGEEIIEVWDSREEANAAAAERFLMQPVLIQQVLSRQPVLRGPTLFRLWRS